MALKSVSASATQRAVRPSRSAVVVRASAESRRAVLSGFAAGAALLVANAAQAASSIDLFDDRKARANGFDLIYEARELDLPQSVRDGLDQARGDISATKKRVQESQQRINRDVSPKIEKAYWTQAREELRLQVGTLRFDLNTLASTKAKDEKKKALALRQDFLTAVEDLDLSLRKKDKESAKSKLQVAQAKLNSVLSAVL